MSNMHSKIHISDDKVIFKSGLYKTIKWFFWVNVAVILSVGVLTGGGGFAIAPILFLLGCVFPFITLYFSKWLAKKSHHIEIFNENSPEQSLKNLYSIIKKLCEKANINNIPEIGIYQSDEVNAFATGASKSDSLIAFSSGLLCKLSEEEIAAVAAHEIAHIANGDMTTLTIVQSVVNALSMIITIPLYSLHILAFFDDRISILQEILIWIVRIIVSAILMFLGNMVVNAFSRKREFEADKLAAQLLNKEFMISALDSLRNDTRNLEMDKSLVAYNTMKISSQLSSFGDLFSTHPSLDRRIAALQQNSIVGGSAYKLQIDNIEDITPVDNLNNATTESKSSISSNHTTSDIYSELIPEILALCIVADGKIEDSEVELAIAFIENDELIHDKHGASRSLVENVEKFGNDRKTSNAIFKLKSTSIISKTSNIMDDLQKDKLNIMLDGMMESVSNSSDNIDTKNIIVAIRNRVFLPKTPKL
jgi:heat shock protein HtpX